MFRLGLWRLRREIPSTSKEKEYVVNTCLGRAIAFTSSHAHTIRQKTPDINTHQMESQDGLRRPERGTTVAGMAPNSSCRSRWYQVFFLKQSGINLKLFCGYPRECHLRRQIKENKAGYATGLLQKRSWRDLQNGHNFSDDLQHVNVIPQPNRFLHLLN